MTIKIQTALCRQICEKSFTALTGQLLESFISHRKNELLQSLETNTSLSKKDRDDIRRKLIKMESYQGSDFERKAKSAILANLNGNYSALATTVSLLVANWEAKL